MSLRSFISAVWIMVFLPQGGCDEDAPVCVGAKKTCGAGSDAASTYQVEAHTSQDERDLFEWLSARGIQLHPSLEVRIGRHGRGLFAWKAIRADEEVIKVPSSGLITVRMWPGLWEKALQVEDVDNVIRSYAVVVAGLARERRNAKSGRGSPIAAYLKSLSEACPQNLAVLDGSPVLELLSMTRANETVSLLVAARRLALQVSASDIADDDITWGLCQACSRGSVHPRLGFVMTPGFELLNHATNVQWPAVVAESIHIHMDGKFPGLGAKIPANSTGAGVGGEVMLNYGGKDGGVSRVELLATFGIASDDDAPILVRAPVHPRGGQREERTAIILPAMRKSMRPSEVASALRPAVRQLRRAVERVALSHTGNPAPGIPPVMDPDWEERDLHAIKLLQSECARLSLARFRKKRERILDIFGTGSSNASAVERTYVKEVLIETETLEVCAGTLKGLSKELSRAGRVK